MEENKNTQVTLENTEELKESPLTISITELYKAYGTKEVLKGINLEVYENELFGFIGRNGIGKSTTIDCMIGAKKFNSGSIIIDGFDITTNEGNISLAGKLNIPLGMSPVNLTVMKR